MSEREPWVHLTRLDDILQLHGEGIRRYGGEISRPREGCVEGSLGAAWNFELYMAAPDAQQGLDLEAEHFCLDVISGAIKDAAGVVSWIGKRLEEFPGA